VSTERPDENVSAPQGRRSAARDPKAAGTPTTPQSPKGIVSNDSAPAIAFVAKQSTSSAPANGSSVAKERSPFVSVGAATARVAHGVG
jgi:hypothetical protein